MLVMFRNNNTIVKKKWLSDGVDGGWGSILEHGVSGSSLLKLI